MIVRLTPLSLCDAKSLVSRRPRGEPKQENGNDIAQHIIDAAPGRSCDQIPLLRASLRRSRGCRHAGTRAATHHHHRAVQSLNGLHMYAGESFGQSGDVLGVTPMSESRAAAIHECSMKATPYNFSTWQTERFSVYGTCMTEHDQMP